MRLTVIIELALGVTQPPLTTLHARDDQLLVKLQLHAATNTLRV